MTKYNKKKHSDEIFKIQIPITTSETVPHALVYNEDRSKIFTVSIPSIQKLFKPDQLKVYVRGRFVNGVFEVTGKPRQQDW